MNKYLELAKSKIVQGWNEIVLHKKAAVSGGVVGVIVGILTPIKAVLVVGVIAIALLVYWVWKDKGTEE